MIIVLELVKEWMIIVLESKEELRAGQSWGLENRDPLTVWDEMKRGAEWATY